MMFSATLPTLTCPHCHESWTPRTAQPKRCPLCSLKLHRAVRVNGNGHHVAIATETYVVTQPTVLIPAITDIAVPIHAGEWIQDSEDCPIVRPE